MDGRRTTKMQYSEYSDFFLHNENQSTIKIQTYNNGNPPMSDGADRMEDASRILVWGTPRTTGHYEPRTRSWGSASRRSDS